MGRSRVRRRHALRGGAEAGARPSVQAADPATEKTMRPMSIDCKERCNKRGLGYKCVLFERSAKATIMKDFVYLADPIDLSLEFRAQSFLGNDLASAFGPVGL